MWLSDASEPWVCAPTAMTRLLRIYLLLLLSNSHRNQQSPVTSSILLRQSLKIDWVLGANESHLMWIRSNGVHLMVNDRCHCPTNKLTWVWELFTSSPRENIYLRLRRILYRDKHQYFRIGENCNICGTKTLLWSQKKQNKNSHKIPIQEWLFRTHTHRAWRMACKLHLLSYWKKLNSQ